MHVGSVRTFDEAMDEELIARARSLRPLLLRTAPLSEERGELVPEVVSTLIDSGFFKMAVPRRWGGLCTSANAMARVVAELARGCPSTAWVITVMNTTVWRHTITSDEAQKDVFGKSVPRFCGVADPPGKARKVDGGYIVESGRWPYASGSHHAEFFHGPIIIEGAKGPPPLAIIPMSELRIERTWKVAGMRATGSDTVVAKNVFVPTHRVPRYEKQFDIGDNVRKHRGEASDFWTALPFIRTKSLGVLLGAAEGLMDYVADGIKERPLLFTNYRRKGDSQFFNAQVGKAGAKIHAVRVLMESMTRAIDRAALAQRPMEPGERAHNRGQMALSIDLLNEAINVLMNAAGSSAFLDANNAQRFWRDFNIGARHVALVPEIGYEVLGRSILGEPEITKPDFI
jgi:3-hydroxy-9,10-secoandrosta-1,3,5(10)-triene-9,17-dione monooxygenase